MKAVRENVVLAGIGLALLLAMGVLFVAHPAWAQHLMRETANADTSFTYQGRLTHDGTAVTGACSARFSLYDAENGGHQVGSTQTSTINPHKGLFTVRLDFGASPFNGSARWLSIAVKCAGDSAWVNLGRTPITVTPYALYALKAAKTEGYANMVTVAKTGGDYTSIQAAIDALPNESELCKHPTLVWVAPGTYTERVTLKPCMTLEGAGRGLTVIKSGGTSMITQATLMVSYQSTIRSLTILNQGEATYATALYAAGVPHRGYPPVILQDVKIQATNVLTGSVAAIGIYATDDSLTLKDVAVQVFSNDADAIGVKMTDSTVIGKPLSLEVNSEQGNAQGIAAPGFSEINLFESSIVAQSWQDGSKATAVALTDANLYATHVSVLSSGTGLHVVGQSGGGGIDLKDSAVSSSVVAIHANGTALVQLDIRESALSGNAGQSLLLDGNRVYAKMRMTELNGGAGSITLQNGAGLTCLEVHNQSFQPVTCP